MRNDNSGLGLVCHDLVKCLLDNLLRFTIKGCNNEENKILRPCLFMLRYGSLIRTYPKLPRPEAAPAEDVTLVSRYTDPYNCEERTFGLRNKQRDIDIRCFCPPLTCVEPAPT